MQCDRWGIATPFNLELLKRVSCVESPHAILCAHWDHEQGRGSSGAAVPAVFAGVSPATNPGARRLGGRRDACPTTARFMDRGTDLSVMEKAERRSETRRGIYPAGT